MNRDRNNTRRTGRGAGAGAGNRGSSRSRSRSRARASSPKNPRNTVVLGEAKVASRHSLDPVLAYTPSGMTQDIFDNLMLLTTETISSVDFLSALGVYRPEIPLQKSSTWKTFVNKIENQGKTVKTKGTPGKPLQAGIYPLGFGGGAVHYYGLRKDPDGVFRVANGYPSRAGIKSDFSIGLDAQQDHSHGLCQTFALMWYYGDEKILKAAKDNVPSNASLNKTSISALKSRVYRANVNIGLKWIQNTLLKTPLTTGALAGEWYFAKDGSYEGEPSHLRVCDYLRCKDEKMITMNEILTIVRHPAYSKFLDIWFYEDELSVYAVNEHVNAYMNEHGGTGAGAGAGAGLFDGDELEDRR